ncbi:NUDIX hydrolase [Rhodococcus sp. BP-241]|jgi:8-oxo-dGTP diphosphatase|uniref:NUDIX hydrolase n=1 Tax=unclassified Rhodococcus (in: high G+C Gram-positive bacteria) TaxID=192944 RepID=UPI001C9B9562|nr:MULTISPECIES: NUDIX hydrolase [unclassified Rhodococcus (in: high G+C Gram-positive bacteria)]MBY6707142.1 NUDIX hydrolase [Rhodococcus sp. BP-241]
MRGDGDGWVFSSDGSRHWGRHGAAGLLLRAPTGSAGSVVLLQHRAAWSHQGGTWALPGGARDSHESAVHAAVREAGEEAGITDDLLTVRDEHVTKIEDSGWSYTTVIADAERELDTVPNGESTELRWVAEHEVDSLPLHPAFAESWPSLRTVPVRAVLAADAPDDLPARTVRLAVGSFGWIVDTVRAENVDAALAAVRNDTDLRVVVVTADDAVRSAVPADVTVLSPDGL